MAKDGGLAAPRAPRVRSETNPGGCLHFDTSIYIEVISSILRPISNYLRRLRMYEAASTQPSKEQWLWVNMQSTNP